MSKSKNETPAAIESAEAILENVFGESLEISPHLEEPNSSSIVANDKEKDTDLKSENQPISPTLETRESFADLPLSQEVQLAIGDAGYQTPTPIQSQVIPHLLYGQDVVAQSQTGSGKTAAFALPILTRVETDCRDTQVLVLVPTRELAIQVGKSFETYGKHVKQFRHAVIYGGQDYEIQYRQLKKGPHVIVGTPGRIIDHIKNKKLDIGEIECLVLDEADEMLNMGFLEDVQFVLEHTPDDRQIALFSATLPEPIRKISQRYLNAPAKVTIKQKTLTADAVRQRAVVTAPRDRVEIMVRFLEAEESDGAIVFTRTRETTTVVADQLTRTGLAAIALNGEMPQKARERTIEKLKSGQLDILVATDIAARGLDVSRISHVFNYDLPEGPETYTHRVGRTGRAGKKGEAIIFVSRAQLGKLKFIEKITRQKIEIVSPPSTEQINKMRIKRYYAAIDDTIENRKMDFFQKLVVDYLEQSDYSLEQVAAAIAMIGQNGRDFLAKDLPQRQFKDDKTNRKSEKRSGRNAKFEGPEQGMSRFRIAVGRRDGIRPGNIVGAVSNEADIDGSDIGSIRIHHSYSTVDLPTDRASEILRLLSDSRVSGRPMRIRPFEDEDRIGRSRQAQRGGRNSKPKAGKQRFEKRGAKPNSRATAKNKKAKRK